MELRCLNKKCLYVWNYKGKITDEKGLISCPKCNYRNLLKSLRALIIKPLNHSQEEHSPLNKFESKKLEQAFKEGKPIKLSELG